jgi:hypothetical protein
MIFRMGIIVLMLGVLSHNAKAHFSPPIVDPFNLLKFKCTRFEKNNNQTYLSVIHFVKQGHTTVKNRAIPNPDISENQNGMLSIEGEVLCYLFNSGEKNFISGFNLFNISYHDGVISGMTGDPYTQTDGSFTLVPLSFSETGKWQFSHTGINSQQITAEFNCTYSDRNLDH